MIKDLYDGFPLREEKFLVVSFTKLTSANGNLYANITLQDATGTIEGKKWSLEEDDFFDFEPGHIVSINGEVLNYKGNLQIKILSGRYVPSESVDLSKFMIQSEHSEAELRARYAELVSKITDTELKNVVEDIYTRFDRAMFTYPAAKRNHHNYLRGLATHTINVAEIAYNTSLRYKNINHSLIIAGALLHDCGKIEELSGPLITTYTTKGGLIGHISIGHTIVKEACDRLHIDTEKQIHLEHIILSHHGKKDFGSPILPSTKEALLIAMIDDLDAKMEMIDGVLDNLSDGEFSQRIYGMDDRQIYKPTK